MVGVASGLCDIELVLHYLVEEEFETLNRETSSEVRVVSDSLVDIDMFTFSMGHVGREFPMPVPRCQGEKEVRRSKVDVHGKELFSFQVTP